MADIDRKWIRAQAAELLEQRDEPASFDQRLRDLLRSLGGEEQAAGVRRFVPGMGDTYGVSVPVLRIIAAELVKWRWSSLQQALALAERLWHNGSRDERVIAAKMLEPLGKLAPEETLELASSFVHDVRNWEECDQLACFGLRYVMQRYPDMVLPRCRVWVGGQGKWVRRFGVAALTSLPKDEAYQPSQQEFTILDLVMGDEAREVQDAVAWTLREIGRRHPTSVADYLRRYAHSDNRATRRIVRAAVKTLPDEEQSAIALLLGD